MREPRFEVRQTTDKGRGVFALDSISRGTRLVAAQGWLAKEAEIEESWVAMQLGPDLWLCSDGKSLDDCINHSCDPNAGYLTGEPILFALRNIAAGEEIAWDYSTSISEAGWRLECRCGSKNCRGTIVSWGELPAAERERLRPMALNYLRTIDQ